MREAIGGSFLFQIVIFFVLLFAGFMCLTINQSKAFNVKDKIIQTIQSYNGIEMATSCVNSNDNTEICEIANYLNESAYRVTGECPTDEYINDEKVTYHGFSRNGKSDDKNPAFCIAKIESDKNIQNRICGNGGNCVMNELPNVLYYRVIVFYQLDLPIFHNIFNFKIKGDTKTMVGDVVS